MGEHVGCWMGGGGWGVEEGYRDWVRDRGGATVVLFVETWYKKAYIMVT